MKQRLLIRADGNSRIGTGHIMRCLSLAQGWRRCGGDVLFASAEITPSLETRLAGDAFPVHRLTANPGTADDAGQTIRLATHPDWTKVDAESGESNGLSQPSSIVVDGYHFDAAYQQAIKAGGLRLLIIDDFGQSKRFYADFVLNQNLSAEEELYKSRESYTRLLLGTRYALLREDFRPYYEWQREIAPIARKVLVTLGGADPDNATDKVIDALLGFDIAVKIVIGGSNPHLPKLRSKLSTADPQFDLLIDVSNMADLMAWADVAIAAGGTTAWELAFMGLPSLLLVLAENQRAVAETLGASGIAQATSHETLRADLATLLNNSERRCVMSTRARQLVDGRGASRVAACLATTEVTLRRVGLEDCRLIWEWANDPAARSASFSSAPIPWEMHRQWFTELLASPTCLYYLALDNQGRRIGQIRYSLSASEAVISVSLAKEARGQGYGTAIIMRGSEQCFADSEVGRIRAYIKLGNDTSARAFLNAGFADVGTAILAGHPTREFLALRDSIS